MNLYKFGVFILGVLVVNLIDKGLGIEWKSYPPWKPWIHKVVYMVWGGVLMSF